MLVETLKIQDKKEQNMENENFTSSSTSLAALVLQKPSSVNNSDVLKIMTAENHYNARLPLLSVRMPRQLRTIQEARSYKMFLCPQASNLSKKCPPKSA